MSDLEKLAAFVAAHDMPLVRVLEDAIEVSCECVHRDGAVSCDMPVKLRTISEARDWLGY